MPALLKHSFLLCSAFFCLLLSSFFTLFNITNPQLILTINCCSGVILFAVWATNRTRRANEKKFDHLLLSKVADHHTLFYAVYHNDSLYATNIPHHIIHTPKQLSLLLKRDHLSPLSGLEPPFFFEGDLPLLPKVPYLVRATAHTYSPASHFLVVTLLESHWLTFINQLHTSQKLGFGLLCDTHLLQHNAYLSPEIIDAKVRNRIDRCTPNLLSSDALPGQAHAHALTLFKPDILPQYCYLTFETKLSRIHAWMKRYDQIPTAAFACNAEGQIIAHNKTFGQTITKPKEKENLGALLCTGSQELKNHFALWQDKQPENSLFHVCFSNLPEQNIILLLMKDNGSALQIGLCIKSEASGFQHQKHTLEAVSHLAGGIAHDFNNIMTTILVSCDLLLTRHTIHDPSFIALHQIQQNTSRAMRLVSQLLAFSGQQILSFQMANLNAVIIALAGGIINRLLGGEIRLSLDLFPKLWQTKIDVTQFEQVLIHLTIRAKHAMAHTPYQVITILTRNILIQDAELNLEKPTYSFNNEAIRNGEYILIEIQDTGKPIAQKDIAKIFTPFSTKSRSLHETGLELSTVYGIIKQINGYIYISSQPKQKTSFYLLLPRIQEKITPTLSTTTHPQDLTGHETVLIVDDELHIRKLCVTAFKNKGYRPLEAPSAERALEVFKEHRHSICVVITDITMQNASGIDLAQKILELEPTMHFVIISGYTDALNRLSQENFHILAKPFHLKQLFTLVRQVIAVRNA